MPCGIWVDPCLALVWRAETEPTNGHETQITVKFPSGSSSPFKHDFLCRIIRFAWSRPLSRLGRVSLYTDIAVSSLAQR